MDKPDYTRLHITPLTPSLLATLLPASILAHARNVSYHTIQTSPENSYGFVDLPREEAERLRKKFQGCFLRGVKVRIEVARPSREEAPPSSASSSLLLPTNKASFSERRRKRSRDELLGVDIGERHVKRGWTMPAHELRTKKVGPKQIHSQTLLSRAPTKSKYTTGPECLFKTVLPANMTTSIPSVGQVSKCKKKQNPRELVVHEFANTTKYATFLKNSSDSKKSPNTLVDRFVDNKGWFDERGNLVEEDCSRDPDRSFRGARYSGGRRDTSSKQVELVTEMEVPSSSSSVEEIGNTYPSSPSEGAYRGTSNTGSIEKRLDDVQLDSESSESECKRNNAINMENETMSSSISTSSLSSQEIERPLYVSSSSSTSSSYLSSSSSDSGNNDEDASEFKTGPPESCGTDARPSSQTSSTSSYTSSSSSSALSSSVSGESEKLASDREENDGDDEEEEEDGEQVQPCTFHSHKLVTNNIQSSSTPSPSNPKPIHPLASLFKRSGSIEPKPAFTFFPTGSDEEDIRSEDQILSFSQSCTRDLSPSTSKRDIEFRDNRSLAPTPESTNINRKIDRPRTCKNSIKEKYDALEMSPEYTGNVERDKCGTRENVKLSSSFIEKSPHSDALVNVTTGNQSQDLEQSDFQKWFWTNQGQVNRAWKKRRKSICKENKSRKNLKKLNR